jgi:Ti-type conjugative transfer relaxase TraA
VAIYHLHVKDISRAEGRNAVNSAAYRHGARMTDERSGEAFDYRAKGDVAYSELTVPANAPAWAKALAKQHEKNPDRASAELWNKVEAHEKRKDARLSREVQIALPAELTLDQNIALVRSFVTEQLASRGMVADWSIHFGKNENVHAHIMLTMRPLTEEGFGAKKTAVIDPKTGEAKRDKRGHIQYQFGSGWGSSEDVAAIREAWADYANLHLMQAGHGVRIDHRSYEAQGIELAPTVHIGVHAQHMNERGKPAERKADFEAARAEGARKIKARPEAVLEAITEKKAVFTRRDIAREINRYIDDPGDFQRIMDRVEASRELVEIAPPRGPRLARYSTRGMIRDEDAMIGAAGRMYLRPSHGVDADLQRAVLSRHRLDAEQRTAFLYATAKGQIKPVIGRAGTGKTYTMKAVREAFEAEGYRVLGAAPSGKAKAGLQEDAGIQSRTLTRLELDWKEGKDRLGPRDVLIVDEAGMMGSRQMGRILAEAERAGAKVILIGDAQQLQPIEAGAPFRAITERTGFAELTTIWRQKEEWAKEATRQLARGEVRKALTAYRVKGFVQMHKSRNAAKEAIARDFLAERTADSSAIVFAHTNEDVAGLNRAIRSARREAGELQGEAPFMTTAGERAFAAGDRVLFRRNSRRQGVTNGTLGTVEEAQAGRLLVRLDNGERRQVDQSSYTDVDHGYAITFGKGQGVSVDRAYVLATDGMDAHSTYVGMSRHKKVAQLYAGRDDFGDESQMGVALEINRPKETTLDFAQRRGLYSWGEWLEDRRAQAVEIGARFERGFQRVKDYFSPPPPKPMDFGFLNHLVKAEERTRPHQQKPPWEEQAWMHLAETGARQITKAHEAYADAQKAESTRLKKERAKLEQEKPKRKREGWGWPLEESPEVYDKRLAASDWQRQMNGYDAAIHKVDANAAAALKDLKATAWNTGEAQAKASHPHLFRAVERVRTAESERKEQERLDKVREIKRGHSHSIQHAREEENKRGRGR